MGNMFSCGGLLGKLQTRLRSDLEAALEARLQEIEVDLTDESITSSDCSGDTTWNGDLGGEVAEDQVRRVFVEGGGGGQKGNSV